MIRKLTTAVAVAGALAVAVPAIAQADKGGNQGNKTHPAQSHKCMPHNSAYVESGTIDATTASTLTSSNGTWTGTLVVDVTRTNHAARADKGKTVTYTFTSSNVRVRFGHGVTALAGGERVKLIGKLATVAKKCPAPSTPAAPVFKKVVVLAAAK
jgi:hypothetical protein